jgi:hypothetical protein
MNQRERFHSVLSYTRPCLFHHEIGLYWAWEQTRDRWRREGWDGTPFEQLFDMDRIERVPLNYGPSPEFQETTVEESEDYRTYWDDEGVLVRVPRRYTRSFMPQFIRYPVESMADLVEFQRTRLRTPYGQRRFGGESVRPVARTVDREARWADWVKASNGRDWATWCFTARWGGYFGPLRSLLGFERACLAFHDEPALVEAFMEERTESMISITEGLLAETDFDIFGFWEDMAYKNGPLISPELFRKFAFRHYRRVCDFLRSRAVEHIFVDSDGDIRKLVPLWMDAGVDGVFPCEFAAGVDVIELRKNCGKGLRLFGGVDKRAFERDRASVVAEIDRISPLIEQGGYLPALDHSAHSDIPWANMRFYMEEMRRRFPR